MASREEIKQVFIICNCGQRHEVKTGIDVPVYWCGNELRVLRSGDIIEQEVLSVK